MPALEVMLRRLTNEAIQNDQGALKLFFTLMERYADLTETTIAPNRNEVLAEDQEILKRHLNDPRYIDVAVRQWQRVTGKDAVLEGTGQTFDEILAARTRAPFDSEVRRGK